jgi:hypothetical protein
LLRWRVEVPYSTHLRCVVEGKFERAPECTDGASLLQVGKDLVEVVEMVLEDHIVSVEDLDIYEF